MKHLNIQLAILLFCVINFTTSQPRRPAQNPPHRSGKGPPNVPNRQNAQTGSQNGPKGSQGQQEKGPPSPNAPKEPNEAKGFPNIPKSPSNNPDQTKESNVKDPRRLNGQQGPQSNPRTLNGHQGSQHDPKQSNPQEKHGKGPSINEMKKPGTAAHSQIRDKTRGHQEPGPDNSKQPPENSPPNNKESHQKSPEKNSHHSPSKGMQNKNSENSPGHNFNNQKPPNSNGLSPQKGMIDPKGSQNNPKSLPNQPDQHSKSASSDPRAHDGQHAFKNDHKQSKPHEKHDTGPPMNELKKHPGAAVHLQNEDQPNRNQGGGPEMFKPLSQNSPHNNKGSYQNSFEKNSHHNPSKGTQNKPAENFPGRNSNNQKPQNLKDLNSPKGSNEPKGSPNNPERPPNTLDPSEKSFQNDQSRKKGQQGLQNDPKYGKPIEKDGKGSSINEPKKPVVAPHSQIGYKPMGHHEPSRDHFKHPSENSPHNNKESHQKSSEQNSHHSPAKGTQNEPAENSPVHNSNNQKPQKSNKFYSPKGLNEPKGSQNNPNSPPNKLEQSEKSSLHDPTGKNGPQGFQNDPKFGKPNEKDGKVSSINEPKKPVAAPHPQIGNKPMGHHEPSRDHFKHPSQNSPHNNQGSHQKSSETSLHHSLAKGTHHKSEKNYPGHNSKHQKLQTSNGLNTPKGPHEPKESQNNLKSVPYQPDHIPRGIDDQAKLQNYPKQSRPHEKHGIGPFVNEPKQPMGAAHSQIENKVSLKKLSPNHFKHPSENSPHNNKGPHQKSSEENSHHSPAKGTQTKPAENSPVHNSYNQNPQKSSQFYSPKGLNEPKGSQNNPKSPSNKLEQSEKSFQNDPTGKHGPQGFQNDPKFGKSNEKDGKVSSINEPKKPVAAPHPQIGNKPMGHHEPSRDHFKHPSQNSPHNNQGSHQKSSETSLHHSLAKGTHHKSEKNYPGHNSKHQKLQTSNGLNTPKGPHEPKESQNNLKSVPYQPDHIPRGIDDQAKLQNYPKQSRPHEKHGIGPFVNEPKQPMGAAHSQIENKVSLKKLSPNHFKHPSENSPHNNKGPHQKSSEENSHHSPAKGTQTKPAENSPVHNSYNQNPQKSSQFYSPKGLNEPKGSQNNPKSPSNKLEQSEKSFQNDPTGKHGPQGFQNDPKFGKSNEKDGKGSSINEPKKPVAAPHSQIGNKPMGHHEPSRDHFKHPSENSPHNNKGSHQKSSETSLHHSPAKGTHHKSAENYPGHNPNHQKLQTSNGLNTPKEPNDPKGSQNNPKSVPNQPDQSGKSALNDSRGINGQEGSQNGPKQSLPIEKHGIFPSINEAKQQVTGAHSKIVDKAIGHKEPSPNHFKNPFENWPNNNKGLHQKSSENTLHHSPAKGTHHKSAENYPGHNPNHQKLQTSNGLNTPKGPNEPMGSQNNPTIVYNKPDQSGKSALNDPRGINGQEGSQNGPKQSRPIERHGIFPSINEAKQPVTAAHSKILDKAIGHKEPSPNHFKNPFENWPNNNKGLHQKSSENTLHHSPAKGTHHKSAENYPWHNPNHQKLQTSNGLNTPKGPNEPMGSQNNPTSVYNKPDQSGKSALNDPRGINGQEGSQNGPKQSRPIERHGIFPSINEAKQPVTAAHSKILDKAIGHKEPSPNHFKNPFENWPNNNKGLHQKSSENTLHHSPAKGTHHKSAENYPGHNSNHQKLQTSKGLNTPKGSNEPKGSQNNPKSVPNQPDQSGNSALNDPRGINGQTGFQNDPKQSKLHEKHGIGPSVNEPKKPMATAHSQIENKVISYQEPIQDHSKQPSENLLHNNNKGSHQKSSHHSLAKGTQHKPAENSPGHNSNNQKLQNSNHLNSSKKPNDPKGSQNNPTSVPNKPDQPGKKALNDPRGINDQEGSQNSPKQSQPIERHGIFPSINEAKQPVTAAHSKILDKAIGHQEPSPNHFKNRFENWPNNNKGLHQKSSENNLHHIPAKGTQHTSAENYPGHNSNDQKSQNLNDLSKKHPNQRQPQNQQLKVPLLPHQTSKSQSNPQSIKPVNKFETHQQQDYIGNEPFKNSRGHDPQEFDVILDAVNSKPNHINHKAIKAEPLINIPPKKAKSSDLETQGIKMFPELESLIYDNEQNKDILNPVYNNNNIYDQQISALPEPLQLAKTVPTHSPKVQTPKVASGYKNTEEDKTFMPTNKKTISTNPPKVPNVYNQLHNWRKKIDDLQNFHRPPEPEPNIEVKAPAKLVTSIPREQDLLPVQNFGQYDIEPRYPEPPPAAFSEIFTSPPRVDIPRVKPVSNRIAYNPKPTTTTSTLPPFEPFLDYDDIDIEPPVQQELQEIEPIQQIQNNEPSFVDVNSPEEYNDKPQENYPYAFVPKPKHSPLINQDPILDNSVDNFEHGFDQFDDEEAEPDLETHPFQDEETNEYTPQEIDTEYYDELRDYVGDSGGQPDFQKVLKPNKPKKWWETLWEKIPYIGSKACLIRSQIVTLTLSIIITSSSSII